MNWPPYRDKEADVSSVSPLSEQSEELWVVCALYTERWSYMLLVGAWKREKQQNKLVE